MNTLKDAIKVAAEETTVIVKYFSVVKERPCMLHLHDSNEQSESTCQKLQFVKTPFI